MKRAIVALVLFVSPVYAAKSKPPIRPQPSSADVTAQANGIIVELKRERDDAQSAALNYAAALSAAQAKLAQVPAPKK